MGRNYNGYFRAEIFCPFIFSKNLPRKTCLSASRGNLIRPEVYPLLEGGFYLKEINNFAILVL
ncbi:MAG: hypothetical protein A3A10_01140 [Candidatus Tagabacteria bacterium RIFCSPLOWO2_01_FULL_42_9]|uniref:Uncharacterized protein n=1 Tax=Candidatus Tagabacteria bacterium RIFCSPLOWO2_01_FULL_42_9 TaxID=1802296 RepID=A0A1G2LTV5_9BACT|nr:MAG: hypothetical protein A3A10_01140 [Candidatus Tagabacteria bacterium RIFCSPLOWO2_01_FULL_42_9]